MANETLNAYGLWQVTTEGDCEGRSIKDLGINEGFLDEIAFSLAGEACYGLRFSAVYPTTAYRTRPPRTEVDVSLDIATRTWDMTNDERVNYFKRMLEGRPITVEPSRCYASVRLINGRSPAEQKQMRKEAARLLALSKLSLADMEALGLK